MRKISLISIGKEINKKKLKYIKKLYFLIQTFPELQIRLKFGKFLFQPKFSEFVCSSSLSQNTVKCLKNIISKVFNTFDYILGQTTGARKLVKMKT